MRPTLDRPDPDLLDRALRFYVRVAWSLHGRRNVVEYLEAYGIPAAAAVAERHDLVWTDADVAARAARKLRKRRGAEAIAARTLLRLWADEAADVRGVLKYEGMLVPLVDGGRVVSVKVYRPAVVKDGKEKRDKYFLKGLGGGYLWGADEVDDDVSTVLVVEGEGDKLALDGALTDFVNGIAVERADVAVVATGGIGVAGDQERLGRIAAWCDPIYQAARRADGLPPRRVIVVADPKPQERRAAARVAEATGAEVSFGRLDPRDLVKSLAVEKIAAA